MNEQITQASVPTPKKSRIPYILVGIVSAVMLAYLGLCLFINLSSSIFPGVSVGTLSLDGMSRQEAQEMLGAELQSILPTIAMPIGHEEMEDELSGNILYLSGYVTVEEAYQVGRSSFLFGGASYLSHLMGKSTEIPLSLDYTQEGKAEVNTIIDQFQGRLNPDPVLPSWAVEGETLVLTRGQRGAIIQREDNLNLLRDNLSGYIAQNLGSSTPPQPIAKTELIATVTSDIELDFNSIQNNESVAVADAYLNQETGEIVPERAGFTFDVDTTRAAFNQLEEGASISIPLTAVSPTVTKDDILNSEFPDILSKEETPIWGSRNRKHNVALSSKSCDNIIIMPDEVWSYNDTTGSRTEAIGYRPANVYVGGDSVDGIGGGICQTSSTIYYALLHTQIEVVERHNHMFSTGYVPDGMDATVYFGSLDLRMRNSTGYPLLLEVDIVNRDGQDYQVVTIRGTKTSDVTVNPYNERYNYTNKEPIFEPDESIPRGTTSKEQGAYTGRSATVYLNYYDKDGELTDTKKLHDDTYRARGATYLYNPLDAESLGLVPPTVVEPTPVPVPPVVEPTPDPVPPVVEPTPDPVPPVVEPTPDPVPPVVEPIPDPVPPVEVDDRLPPPGF